MTLRPGQRLDTVPVIPMTPAQQYRRIATEVFMWIGFLGLAIDAYGPDIMKLAPSLRWMPAALSLLSLAIKVVQKARDLRNITHV